MSDPSSIACGPFLLRELIGRGGMAQVWRGVHRAHGAPVAVKVITTKRASSQNYVESFRREVQAVAGLDHPGIVTVYDYGQIDEDAQALDERLVAGSPFLAMELVEGGTLASRQVVQGWPDLRKLLLGLLDALAHAHARQVIHRDLKPANVLVVADESFSDKDSFSDKTGGIAVKLTDFGVAHAFRSRHDFERADLRSSSAGTPQYMPPEQFNANWRDFGPWTDLYALGAMAYELACGRPPFQGSNPIKLGIKHMRQAPPKLQSTFDVPSALEPWIHRLLAKAPHQRYQRAADAALALSEMPQFPRSWWQTQPGMPVDRSSLDAEPADAAAAVAADDTIVDIGPPTLLMAARAPVGDTGVEAIPGGLESVEPGAMEFEPIELPSMPATWQDGSLERAPAHLSGAGLGLFGLRELPLVDRKAERDAIWQALEQVFAHRESRVVVLRGSSGSGKSRLAEWMCQRADALGLVEVLCAVHSQHTGAAAGIAGMIDSWFRCWGLERDAVHKRIARVLEQWAPQVFDDDDCRALTEIVRPSGEADQTDTVGYRFSSPVERRRIVARLVESLGAQRPVAVWLDDVQWGADTLEFVEHVLDADRALPALFVMTVREEALEDASAAAKLLDRLEARPQVDVIPVAELAASDHEELVRSMLPLSPDLARRVVGATGGNPLFAVQLVGDWVERGVLEQGPQGFVLDPSAGVELPQDVHQLSETRIEHLLSKVADARRAEARQALEIAAALGTQVDEREWGAACRAAGVTVDGVAVDGVAADGDQIHRDHLVEMMVNSRLAERDDHGWAFAHGVVRESLERLALSQERWVSHHRACAAALEQVHTLESPQIIERVAEHLVRGDRAEQALEPLLLAARARCERGELQEVCAVIERREQILGQEGVPDDDRRWAQGWVVAARSLAHLGDEDGAVERLDGATRHATSQWADQWADVLCVERHTRGMIQCRCGDVDDGFRSFEEALEFSKQAGDQIFAARSLGWMGEIHRQRAEFDQAIECLEQAKRAFASGDHVYGVAETLTDRAYLDMQMGAYDTAEDHLTQALDIWRHAETRHPVGLGNTYNSIGELARLLGRPRQALEYYSKALSLWARSGMTHFEDVTNLNIGLALLLADDYDRAQPVLESVEETLHAPNQAMCRLALMACAASREDWPQWERLAALAIDWFAEHEFYEQANAWTAERAADLACAGERPRYAAPLYELSRRQWEAIGDREGVERVEQKRSP